MTYLVNEIFYSVQGEGYWSGRPAVFVRFAKCNLWNGKETHRASAICTFCDTNFVDYTPFRADEIRAVINELWPEGGQPMVVFTGGEPLLQLDQKLHDAIDRDGWYTAIETNGTLPLEFNIDWVCVSPKTPTVRITTGDELKLVYPQERVHPEMFDRLAFDHFWISPMNRINELDKVHAYAAYDYVLEHPQWRLNTQAHKVIGVR